MNVLRGNQEQAIQVSKDNNFSSGIHFHATGTGKSWIALELILEYNRAFPTSNILWLCEQKSILIEQFDSNTLKKKGYRHINATFLVINYTVHKDSDWASKLNSAVFWKKPILLIMNRSYLVSQLRYERLKTEFGLVIHDECHSIKNNSTQKFYQYMLSKYPAIRCLGFTATPFTEVAPFQTILSNYTIYNAFCDNVIVGPKIKWISSQKEFDDVQIMNVCKENIQQLPYRKVLVWCGIIEKCYELATLWKREFKDYLVVVDTSKEENDDYKLFAESENNAILFCACKHREGSDISNLDGCIFLDQVENRNAKTFVQCIGRVLRKDKLQKKNYGLIMDFNAISCIKICDRMNSYLNCDHGFPWKYEYIEKKIGTLPFIEHSLTLRETFVTNKKLIHHSIGDVVHKFKKKCPNDKEYQDRLHLELDIIQRKDLACYLLRAVHILELTDFIPHVTRGSCGSSLVCYLLGISNVDPVKCNIKFARFLNEFRDNLPDIDFDFPHYLRDEVFLKLELEWPNQVARISNHVHWHDKSAIRESLRKEGFRHRISKESLHQFVSDLPLETQQSIKKNTKELENTFRHYSLHCGGIVFFHNGIPKDIILQKRTLSQIVYDKNDVARVQNFKIDILSSRGISQLIGIIGRNIDFTDCPYDEKTYRMLQEGDNIGVTLAESPLMKKALLIVQPKSLDDLALCLAIIRPAAKDSRCEQNCIDYSTKFIYDDDAISLLSNYLGIDDGLADKFRRNFAKDKWSKEEKQQYEKLMNELPEKKRNELLEHLKNLRLYSFCKSHSYSYAQLVYKLAYQKAHNPKKFWYSTCRSVKSYYRKWVHMYEAVRNGVDFTTLIKSKSIYAENRKKNFWKMKPEEQIKKYGYWHMDSFTFFPNCYFYRKDEEYLFGGLIAWSRMLSTKPLSIVCLIGVGPGKFIEVLIKKSYVDSTHHGVKGRAVLKNLKENTYEASYAKFY